MLNNHGSHHHHHQQQQHQQQHNQHPLPTTTTNNIALTTTTTTTATTTPAPVRKKSRKDVPLSSSPGLLVSSSSGSPAGQHAGESDGGHSSDGCGDRKRKKARTTFTGRQIFELERQFELKKYLSSSERSEMAKLLGVTETQVKNKFKKVKYKCQTFENQDFSTYMYFQ